MKVTDNLWYQSPQNWNAYGLRWEFTYNQLTAKRTITAPGFKLDILVTDIGRFRSPYLWLQGWAKKNQNRLPSQDSEAVTPELELFPTPKRPPEIVQAEVVTEELTETQELTYDEERDRLNLERKVERAFYHAGLALRELRERRLYRSTHKSFEEYCRDRFGMKQSRSYQMIDAAKVVDNLLEKVPPLVEDPDHPTKKVPQIVELLPTNEAQCRPLTKLEPDQQREAWRKAVESCGGSVPSGKIVKDIVQRIKEKPLAPVPNPYHLGEVCRIMTSSDPEIKGKGGMWCIVSEIHEFSCTVKTYQGAITIRLDNLRLIDYSTADCEAMGKLCDRLHHLYSEDMEETACAVLDLLGKLDRPYLTALEEKLLTVLEAQ